MISKRSGSNMDLKRFAAPSSGKAMAFTPAAASRGSKQGIVVRLRPSGEFPAFGPSGRRFTGHAVDEVLMQFKAETAGHFS